MGGRTVSEAPFRWHSRRKQIHKFSAVTGNTHLRPLTQTRQGKLGRLCHISSLFAPSLRFFSLSFGQLTMIYWFFFSLEQTITEHCRETPHPPPTPISVVSGKVIYAWIGWLWPESMTEFPSVKRCLLQLNSLLFIKHFKTTEYTQYTSRQLRTKVKHTQQ